MNSQRKISLQIPAVDKSQLISIDKLEPNLTGQQVLTERVGDTS